MTFATANRRNIDIHTEDHHLPFAWGCMECLCTIPKQSFHKDRAGRGCKNRKYQCVDKEQQLEEPAALSRYHKWNVTTTKALWRISRKGSAKNEGQRIRGVYRKYISPFRMTSLDVSLGEAPVEKEARYGTRGRKKEEERRRKAEGGREETR